MKKEEFYMGDRISDKIEEIQGYLDELKMCVPDSFDEYLGSKLKKAACERYAEIIIEAVVDLAFLFIKLKNLKIPESDLEAFDILLENNILSSSLSKNLQDAKRMRNVLAHEYGEVDDLIVYHAVREELCKDVREFLDAVKRKL